jgi:TPR repeat protein
VNQDYKEAKKWFRKAANQGLKPAIDALNEF